MSDEDEEYPFTDKWISFVKGNTKAIIAQLKKIWRKRNSKQRSDE
jgi:hypothetical protein